MEQRFEVRNRLGQVVAIALYDPTNGLEAPPAPEAPAPPAHDFDIVSGFCRRCDMSEAAYFSNFEPCPDAQLFSVCHTQLENRSEQLLFESGEVNALFGIG